MIGWLFCLCFFLFSTIVSLQDSPQILIEIGVGDFLEGLDVVDGDEMAVEIHEFDADFLEGALGEEMTLDT